MDGSTPLRRTALEDWARLEHEVPGVLVRWSGSLAWGEEALSETDKLGADERLATPMRSDAWSPTFGRSCAKRSGGHAMGRSTRSR
jgi:hypothetical protein